MKDSILTILRDKKTSRRDFRKASDQITHLLAQKTFQLVKETPVSITTPIAKARGYQTKQPIILVPILRSGLAFLPVFMYYFEDSRIGFIGLKRNEKTKIASFYYTNIPTIGKNDLVILLDPMLATGGSGAQAIELLKTKKAREEQIVFVTLVAAPEGINKIKKTFPKVKLLTEIVDPKLNKDKYIVPGLGDYGDRYFGTD